jgi:hypothetical protein
MKSNTYYESQIHRLAEMRNELTRSRAAWFRHLALMASAVLSINVALGADGRSGLQWMGSALLILCILSALAASYFEVHVLKRAAKRYQENIQTSLAEGREISPAYAGKPVVFSVAEILAVTSFVSSLFVLVL